MKSNVEAADSFAIFLDQRLRIQFGIYQDRIDSGVAEERLNHMHWRVVVEMLGRENAPAIVGLQAERRTIRFLDAGIG